MRMLMRAPKKQRQFFGGRAGSYTINAERFRKGGGKRGRRRRRVKIVNGVGSKSIDLRSSRASASAGASSPARGRRRLWLIVARSSSSSSSSCASGRPPELGEQAPAASSPRRRGPAPAARPRVPSAAPSSSRGSRRRRRRRRRRRGLRRGPPLLLGPRLHVQRLHRALDRLEVGPVLGPARPAGPHHLGQPRRAASGDRRPQALLDDAHRGLQGGEIGVGDAPCRVERRGERRASHEFFIRCR